MKDLLTLTDKGIYCKEGDFYIDPWKPVDKAVITHAHSDHARWGSSHYLAQVDNKNILKLRLGDISLQTAQYEEKININGIKISFHPAGHIFGSSQVKVEGPKSVWVVTGDYKIEPDNTTVDFKPVECDTLITESTFGLPVFKWENQEKVFDQINNWWASNARDGKTSVLCGYALGKAQRLLKNVNSDIGEIFVHGAVHNVNEALIASGLNLPATTYATPEISKERYIGSLVIAPPSALGTSWMRKFNPYEVAFVSGWMNIRGIKRRRNMGTGFVMSDHADWEGLNQVVKLSKAEKVFVTHGYQDVFSKWLNENGIESHIMETLFEGEIEDN